MKLKKMIQFEVAGYSHHWTNINKIWDGDSDFDSPAQLVPEPTNKYDPNAINHGRWKAYRIRSGKEAQKGQRSIAARDNRVYVCVHPGRE